VRIRYYIHVWQGLLMFIAGLIGVIGAFAGYIHAGGGEEILRRALSRIETGAVRFDALKVDWLAGEMRVYGVEKQNSYVYGQGEALTVFEGLRADQLRVKMDVYPWPPEVTKVTVSGIKNAAIKVSDGFLQFGNLPRRAVDAPPLPPIAFEDCNLKIAIGDLQPVVLTGCSGELRIGTGNSLKGTFSLQQLNGRPFNFKLETLEDGRWVFAGEEIHLDTGQTLNVRGKNPLAGKVDPVGMLVAALFSGQMGAKGSVKFLRVVVQPATANTKFVCDGEVGFSNLEFQLPPSDAQASKVLPDQLMRLLGMDEAGGANLWPRWMQVDRIRTGTDGRMAFHMADGKLNFAADEGPGSALIGILHGKSLPPLESLKGWVETDAESNPRRIILRGYLGNDLSFETRVQRADDNSRVYGLVLQPRTGDYQDVTFNRPLWRFASRVEDYVSVDTRPAKDEMGERPLVKFEIEGDARHFPWPEFLLPGMRDISGRLYANGRFTDASRLRIDDLRFDSGAAIVYGGSRHEGGQGSPDFGPLWQSLQSLYDTPLPWSITDVTLRGKVVAQFGLDLTWESTEFKDVKLISGQILHAGLSSNLGIAGMDISAKHVRTAKKSELTVLAGVKKEDAPTKYLWSASLTGYWPTKADDPTSGEFTFKEENVPFNLHPQREQLDRNYVSEDRRRVNRTTRVNITNGRAERQISP